MRESCTSSLFNFLKNERLALPSYDAIEYPFLSNHSATVVVYYPRGELK